MKILEISLLVISMSFFIGCNGISKNDKQIQTVSIPEVREEVNTAPLVYKPFKLYHNDTLQYLKQNFVDNKEYYLNKPLKVLLNQFEIEIDHVIPADTGYYRKGRFISYININFRKKEVAEGLDYYRKKRGVLTILFKNEIPEDTLITANGSYNFKWSNRLKHFLEDKKVKDIMVNKDFYK